MSYIILRTLYVPILLSVYMHWNTFTIIHLISETDLFISKMKQSPHALYKMPDESNQVFI